MSGDEINSMNWSSKTISMHSFSHQPTAIYIILKMHDWLRHFHVIRVYYDGCVVHESSDEDDLEKRAHYYNAQKHHDTLL